LYPHLWSLSVIQTLFWRTSQAKILCFGVAQRLQEWHGGKDKALNLHLVGQRKLVNPIGGELPNDSIGNVVEGVDVPKLGKLNYMHFI
jgi:hypothetical protein